MKRLVRALFVLSGLCLLHGCGGGSAPMTPPPPPATHFSVVPGQANATAGTAFNFTVTALDASKNVATGYSGTVHFTSSDAQAVFSPASSTLTNGTGTFSATLKTAGAQTINATDTINASISGTSSINVGAGAATSFSVIPAQATAPAGTPFNFTVTALDPWNNVATGYSGTVHFTSTDTQAALPANSMLTSGTATFSATLNTAGNWTITATDTATASISGTSSAILVSGPATHFSVTAPTATTAGTSFDFTVTVLDALNNVATGYSGTVHFTSSDAKADLPPDQLMTSGNATTFPAGLKTTGPQEITATDTVTAITGTSKLIAVSAAAAANPVPFISQPLSPETVEPGGGGFLLTVDGSGFVSGAKVQWNGNALATNFVSNSKLTATVPASDISTPNTASVTVVNPAPGGGVSNVVFFEATVPTAAIALSALPLSAGSFSTTGDFNHDGKLDLANTGSNNVSVFLGNGDGTFQPAANYAVGSNPTAVAAGDLNHDGKLDLVVANNQSYNVSILLGNGDGTFQPAVNYGIPSCCPTMVALGDFNGDGKLDLVVTIGNPGALGPGTVSIFLGNGDGTFQAALNYAAGSDPYGVAVGDFNGDGKLDLAVTDVFGNDVGVLLGNGDGTFQPALDYPVGNQPFTVVAGDFNGDGILDLAVATGNGVSVLLGNGNGTFQSAVNYGTGLLPGLVAGDFNGDGKVDLAESVGILLGNGDGTFQPVIYSGTGSYGDPLAVGDFNGQGRLDLVVPNSLLLQSTLVPSATSFTFPLQVLQSGSVGQILTLTNVSAQTLSVSGILLTGANAADFSENDTCSSPLVLGATCTVTVTFTPTQLGPRNASLTISSNGVGSPLSVALNGIGVVSGPNATLSTTSLSISCAIQCRPMPPNCDCVCTSTPPQPITLSDFGSNDLGITGITTASPFSETNTCDSSLGAGNSCTVGVGFRSTTTGTFTGTLDINDNAPGSPQVVNLTGKMQCAER